MPCTSPCRRPDIIPRAAWPRRGWSGRYPDRAGHDAGHAAVVEATELNRRLQAEGWRIADPMAGSRAPLVDDA